MVAENGPAQLAGQREHVRNDGRRVNRLTHRAASNPHTATTPHGLDSGPFGGHLKLPKLSDHLKHECLLLSLRNHSVLPV